MVNEEDNINLEVDEVNLEDLIVLGEHKKIPVQVTYPKEDGSKVKAKVLIRQLTLKETEDIPINTNSLYLINLSILGIAMFKMDGSKFSSKEIVALPIGVVNAISEKIREISGVEFSTMKLENF